MKNYQPDYYNNFKCIADKCSITCCQEWKIAVDDATNRKWKKLSLRILYLQPLFLLIKCLEKVTI